MPEPPGRWFDADAVDASAEAYEKLQTPDAYLGFASFAITALLAAMGPPDRAKKKRWVPLALLAKATADAMQAGKLTYDQWAHHRRFCLWCLGAAGASFEILRSAIPEAIDAIRRRGPGRGW